MTLLSTEEVLQLSLSIQDSLSGSRYACSSLSRITGGSSSFTFRGLLQLPVTLADETIVSTVIVKKATNFAAINREFALDSNRSMYENTMLKASHGVKFGNATMTIPVTSPRTLFYDHQSHIQIVEDLQPAIDLASILASSAISHLPDSRYTTLGFALGAWLRSFHNWAQEPEQVELRDTIAQNKSSQTLKWRTTYETIEAIVGLFAIISEEDKRILTQVRNRAASESEQQTHCKKDDQVGHVGFGVIHGDFWTGNVLTSPTKSKLHVIDWEFAQLGYRATDLGQMIGDLIEKSYMFDSAGSHCEMMIRALAEGYGAISEKTSYRVVTHAGVHVINWCSRHPGAEVEGKVDVMVQRAVEIVARAWKEDRKWFESDLLRCLFQ